MYIVYKTTNIVTGQIYIGVHRQDTKSPLDFDGYLGSGNWDNNITKLKCKELHPNKYSLGEALDLYGCDSFRRETLYFTDDINDAYNEEAKLVHIDFIKSDLNYNLIVGGQIPPNHKNYIWINNGIKEYRITKTSTISNEFTLGRLPVKDSTKLKHRINAIKNGNRPPIHTKQNGYWSGERLERARQTFAIVGKNKNVEWSGERKIKHSNRMSGERNPAFNSTYIWINNGTMQRRWVSSVKELPDGFSLGTVPRKVKNEKQKIVSCPYCQKSGGEGSMKRWHFDNCKLRSLFVL